MNKPTLIIGMPPPKDGPPEPPEMNEICIPAAALAAQDDSGAVPPSEGDTVDFSVSGKVTRVDGDNVYVAIEKANGQPVEGSKDEEGMEDADEEGKEEGDLRGKAQAEDNMPY